MASLLLRVNVAVCLSPAGFTHAQLQELAALSAGTTVAFKKLGLATQGRSRPAAVSTVSMAHIDAYTSVLRLSTDAALKLTAAVEHVSYSTLKEEHKEWEEKGELQEKDSSLRGKGNPTHPLHPSSGTDESEASGPSLGAELLIHKLVQKQKMECISLNATMIAGELQKELGVQTTTRTVQRWMHALGYSWQKKNYVGGMKPAAKNVRIRQFIMEYAAALKEEADGNAIVVYVDESYIHSHTAKKMGWFQLHDTSVNGDADGKRLIILHAMTDSKLLAVADAISTNWMNEMALTAELVFEEVLEDGQDGADYHNTMTGPKFVSWLRNRLIHTFKHLFPGKKMILVMDNASYHKARDETWVSAGASQSKTQLADRLIALEVEKLTTVRSAGGSRVVPSYLFHSSIGEGGPSKEDLQAAVQKWLDAHPGHNRTIVEQIMDAEGFSIVYTPPFCPDVQPIELLWGKIKGSVAAQSTHNRSITETRTQTEDAFAAITFTFCNEVVRHCHDWIDSWLQTDAAEDLKQCGTLAGVIKSLPLLNLAFQHTPAMTPAAQSSIPAAASSSAASAAAPSRALRTRR